MPMNKPQTENPESRNNEEIKLTLPVNAAYVSAARLTASSVANRLGFEIDEIEDIKAAVSEACTYIIKKHISNTPNNFKIVFSYINKILQITLSIKSSVKNIPEDDEMGLLVIKALSDSLSINNNNDILTIVISKKHIQTSFEE